MIASDEDALICDFAQYYHVLHWRALPVKLAATLAAGLPPDSRSMMLLHGAAITLENQLRAIIADALHQLNWRIADGRPSTFPPSILTRLQGEDEDSDSGSVRVFDSPEEFEAALHTIEGGEPHGN